MRLPFADADVRRRRQRLRRAQPGRRRDGLAEQVRVLRPGGRLVILETTPGPRGWLRTFFELYFRRLVPLLGRLIAGDASAYTYLPESTLAFLEPSRWRDVCVRTGLRDVQTRALALGMRRADVGAEAPVILRAIQGGTACDHLPGTPGASRAVGAGTRAWRSSASPGPRTTRRASRADRRGASRGVSTAPNRPPAESTSASRAAARRSRGPMPMAGSSCRCPRAQYTITATAPTASASRPYVPVEAGSGLPLDIGILDLGGGVAGCGRPISVTAPVLPTFTPTAAPTAVPAVPPPTPTPVPPPPTATPAPASPSRRCTHRPDSAPEDDGMPADRVGRLALRRA